MTAPVLNFQPYNPVDTALKAALGVYSGLGEGAHRQAQTALNQEQLKYYGPQAEADIAYRNALINSTQANTAATQYDLEMAKKLKPLEYQEEQLKYENSKREYDLNQMLHKYGAYDEKSRAYLMTAIAKDYRENGGRNFPEFGQYMQGMPGANGASNAMPTNNPGQPQPPSLNPKIMNPVDAGVAQSLAKPNPNNMGNVPNNGMPAQPQMAPNNTAVNAAPGLMNMLGIPSEPKPVQQEKPTQQEIVAMDLNIPDTNKEADETLKPFKNPLEDYYKGQEEAAAWEQKAPEEKIRTKAGIEAYERGKVGAYNKQMEVYSASADAAEKQNVELEAALDSFKKIPSYQKGMIGGMVSALAQESKLFESFKSGLVLTEMQQAIGVSTNEDREEMAKKYGNRTMDDDTIEELITLRTIMNDREGQRLRFYADRQGQDTWQISKEWNERLKERKLFDDPRLKKLKFSQDLRKMTPAQRRQFIEKKEMEKALSQEKPAPVGGMM